MTSKDFQLIAEVIQTLDLNYAQIDNVVNVFADKLDETHPRFDREKFLDEARQYA